MDALRHSCFSHRLSRGNFMFFFDKGETPFSSATIFPPKSFTKVTIIRSKRFEDEIRSIPLQKKKKG